MSCMSLFSWSIMTRTKPVFTSLILLTFGVFIGYQIAVVHLQTEKGAGQVILSQKQFENILNNINSETWNQQREPSNLELRNESSQVDDKQQARTNGGPTKHTPSHILPDVGTFLKSSCTRLWRGNNSWFQARYEREMKPVWTRDNAEPSSDVFNWWNHIQRGNNSLEEVLKAVEDLLPAKPLLAINETACLRCAVVGNSGNILKSRYGEFIDEHNWIFRMNKCPTDSYEANVGSKTTYYTAYPGSFHEKYLKKDSFLLFIPFKAADIKWLVTKLGTSDAQNKIRRDRVVIYNPGLMWYTRHVWNEGKGRYPSTGLLTVMFALHTCDEVNLFGFGPNSLGYWDHYFENNTGEGNSAFRKTFIHDADSEQELLYKLDAIGKIKFYKGQR